MSHTRKNAWQLGGDWADPILWYARGVKAMKARKLNEGTGWRFYGAIHGIDRDLWTQYGISARRIRRRAMPTSRPFGPCQHGSWYFLPWHRGYLIAFEATFATRWSPGWARRLGTAVLELLQTR